jgi:hypothetical protein
MIAAFADNNDGDVLPQDMRDLVESMKFARGMFYISSAIATVIATPGTYAKMLAGTTLVSANRFTMPASNRLTYSGPEDVHVLVHATLSMTTASNNQVTGWKFYKNAGMTSEEILEHSYIQRKTGTGADVGALAIMGGVDMSADDYIELWCTNETGASNLTAEGGCIRALGVFM